MKATKCSNVRAVLLPSTTFLALCIFLHVGVRFSDCSTPPTIKPFSFAKVASKGDKISIICLVTEGTPPFSFSWSKDGKEIQTTENVKVKTESDYSLTIISSIDERSAGNYTCIVKNIFGFDTHSAYLDVEAPPVFKKTTTDTNVVQGGSVVLSCQATGSPKPTVKWSMPSGAADEEVLFAASDSRIRVFSNGTLLIDKVTTEEAGKYTCRAQNGIGSVSHSLYLHVRAFLYACNTRTTRRATSNVFGLLATVAAKRRIRPRSVVSVFGNGHRRPCYDVA
ncbi:hypothetical protein MRX96_037231 [Rhipicephalus microplus]